MRVEVYRNLHKQCWSVRDTKTRRVINHVDNIHIEDATLVVQQSGREKVLRERRKNVHAFIKGYINRIEENWYTVQEISYNPYKNTTFVVKDTEVPVHNASHVYLNTNGKAYMEIN